MDASGNPVGPPVAGFVQAGNVIPQYDLAEVPNVGKRVFTNVDPNNFGPRLGFAFAPFDSGRLTLRGGYGVFYSRPSLVYLTNTINAPPTYAISPESGGCSGSFGRPFRPTAVARSIPRRSFPAYL